MSDECFPEPPLTPGARRAMTLAAGWAGCHDSGELTPPAVLLGLLGESECRAAAILRRRGIDLASVQQHWPELSDPPDVAPPPESDRRSEASWRLSLETEASLHLATLWLGEHGLPPELATEHLLLGLTAGGHPTARWLHSRGLTREAMEDELRQLYGQTIAWRSEETLDASEDIAPCPGPEGAVAEASVHREPVSSLASAAEVIGVLRIVDAAANRAREGLRVAEDYVRFVLDDGHLTGRLKALRHAMVEALVGVPLVDRLAARETLADVGTELSTESEHRRSGCGDVVAAAFARLQESLRSLEEYGKCLATLAAADCQSGLPAPPEAEAGDPAVRPSAPRFRSDFAAEIERIRYESYTLQRAVEITRASGARLAGARLYVLVDGLDSSEDFDMLVRDLVLAGADVLQLRDKRLSDRELLERARRMRQLTLGSRTLFVMNDRPDLAVLAEADGVHVGQEELCVKDVRTLVGPDMLLGVSVHSLQQARQAVLAGANYLGVGPTFPSQTKSFDAYPGPELLRAVAAEIRLPAFAVGGINAENLAEVLGTGVTRVAVGHAVTGAANPAAALSVLRERLGPT